MNQNSAILRAVEKPKKYFDLPDLYLVFGVQDFFPSGGYSVEIEKIDGILYGGTPQCFFAKVKVRKPGWDCMTPAVMTGPVQFVLVPKQYQYAFVDFVEETFTCE